MTHLRPQRRSTSSPLTIDVRSRILIRRFAISASGGRDATGVTSCRWSVGPGRSRSARPRPVDEPDVLGADVHVPDEGRRSRRQRRHTFGWSQPRRPELRTAGPHRRRSVGVGPHWRSVHRQRPSPAMAGRRPHRRDRTGLSAGWIDTQESGCPGEADLLKVEQQRLDQIGFRESAAGGQCPRPARCRPSGPHQTGDAPVRRP